MAGVSVKTPDELMQLFAEMERFPEWVQSPTRELLQYIYDEAQKYPPRLANQRYVRTFKLRGSWQMKPENSGKVLGKVVSAYPAYNRYVMKHGEQAMIHQGRWSTDKSIAEDAEKKAPSIFEPWITAQIP